MEVLLLGTGAADGWPNAFCRCASCTDLRGRADLHSPTAALVDGKVLVDAGPAVEANAQRFGADLADVGTVLVTHAHSDHLAPAFLLHRSWLQAPAMQVYGPTPVIEACADWLAPGQTTVRLHRVRAGDTWAADGYRVTAIPAAHEAFGEALLYRIDGADASLLYATDTGPWAAGALDLLGDRPLDLVLLEETFGDRPPPPGHLGLPGFADSVRALRDRGLADPATQVLAVHLSHHNPPMADLTARLAASGARPAHDGEVLRVSAQSRRGPRSGGSDDQGNEIQSEVRRHT